MEGGGPEKQVTVALPGYMTNFHFKNELGLWLGTAGLC